LAHAAGRTRHDARSGKPLLIRRSFKMKSMSSFLSTASFAAALGIATSAIAATAMGTITDIDLGTNRITLSNGDIFKLGTGLGASRYRVGEQVRVSWEMGPQGYKQAYQVIPIL
jgi:Cu/Ag efflux protein CusF